MEIKMHKKFSIVLLLLFVSGCKIPTITETYDPDYSPQISVFAIISTDNNHEFVVVERTLQLNENDKTTSGDLNTIIDDARVFIIDNTDTVQFKFYKRPQSSDIDTTYLAKGIYLDLNNEFIAKSGSTYQLVVEMTDGRTVKSSTTVPEIPIISKPLPWRFLQKDTIKNATVHWQDDPNTIAYNIDFLIEIDSENKERIDIMEGSYFYGSPAVLSELDDFLLINDIIPLSFIATIKVVALDRNSYDYLDKGTIATMVGTDLNLIEGGIGAFGSFSVDSVQIRLK